MTCDDWVRARLGDFVEIKHGWPFKGAHFCPPGDDLPIVVNIGNFRYTGGFRFESTTVRAYSGDYPSAYELAPGDILLVMTCQTQGGEILGIPGRVPRDGRTYLHNQRLGRVRFRPGTELDRDFAYWLFLTPQFNSELFRTASGSKILHTSPARIEAFKTEFPPLDEQRRIACVLGALDDKIDSNRRLGAILAELISTTFRHRVVEQHSDRWATSDLTSIARFVNGRAFTKDANGGGRPILRIKELSSGLSDATLYSDIEASDDNIARHHDLLFAWSGSLDLYRWQGPESLINQHIFKVLPLEGFPAWFVAGWIRTHMPEFQRIAKDKATTMGHIKREHLTRAAVRIPPSALLNELDGALSPLDAQIGALAAETITLTAARDALLPKLISGEIRVPEAAEPDDLIGLAREGIAA